MRLFIGFSIIIISFGIAYIRYYSLSKRAKANEFFCQLSSKLISNNTHEMLPLPNVFTEICNSYLDESPLLENSAETFEYISKTFSDAFDYNKITDALLKYTKASENELIDYGKDLKSIAENGYEKACAELNKYGKPAFLLYPAAALTVLIVLI